MLKKNFFEIRVKKAPSPAPLDLSQSPSWADQMAEINSPSEPSTPQVGKAGDNPSGPPPSAE